MYGTSHGDPLEVLRIADSGLAYPINKLHTRKIMINIDEEDKVEEDKDRKSMKNV